jgi:GT2 family glycosyltransferase
MTSLLPQEELGSKKNLGGTFHPRSFNMGMSKEVYRKTQGFIITRMGEDIEFSIRAISLGFKSGLIPEAFIYHKRRTSFIQFYKQLRFLEKQESISVAFFQRTQIGTHLSNGIYTWLV